MGNICELWRRAVDRAKLLLCSLSSRKDQKLKNFKFFPSLPPEIRLMIWRATVEGEQRLVYYSEPVSTHKRAISDPYTPLLLHINRESREVGLQIYGAMNTTIQTTTQMTNPKVFPHFYHSCMYISYRFDTIVSWNSSAEYPMHGGIYSLFAENVAISVEFWEVLLEDPSEYEAWRDRSRSLKKLTIIWDYEYEPLMRIIMEQNDGSWPDEHLVKKELTRWKKAIKFDRKEHPRWNNIQLEVGRISLETPTHRIASVELFGFKPFNNMP